MASTLANPKSRTQPALRAGNIEKTLLDRLQSTFGLGLLGSLLVYAALPPLDLWPLAWIAPVPWLLLIRQPELPGRRPYRALWLAGFISLLAVLLFAAARHSTSLKGA